jgi:Domain of Unknown Function (DUF1080)
MTIRHMTSPVEKLASLGSHSWRAAFIACSLTLAMCMFIQAADDEGPTYLDAASAGKDFLIQGEYVGVVDGGQTWGAQVIALGNGKFRCVGYPDGLPGDGYKPGTAKRESEGAFDGNVVKLQGDEFKLEIADGKIKVLTVDGQLIGTLMQVKRESPTLGQKPPQDAKILFDGKSADQFENGKLTENQLLAADCASKEKFGDHFLHIEFRTPFRPLARGQARGNSGVYLQSRYELQVLDSFGLTGENNECGGIYSIAKPIVNMCYPPLSWQTYDIEFKAAKYDDAGKKIQNAQTTIKHNGVTIHDKLDLKDGTPGRLPEGKAIEGVYLQGHGNPVVYRNIWVVKR